jgi:hypothetical protein
MDKNSKSVAFGGCPAFLPDEIDYWLNQGLYQEINTKFTGNNPSKVAFERSIKRMHDLEGLLRTDTVTAEADTTCNRCYVTDLHNDKRMFFVTALLKFGNSCANVTLVDHESAKKFIKTHNNNPWIETPMGVVEDNKLYVYYDPISMKSDNYSLDITYLKQPTKIQDLPVTGMDEIPEYMQYEVINKAVELALEDIESKRVQTKTAQNQLDE